MSSDALAKISVWIMILGMATLLCLMVFAVVGVSMSR